VPNLIDRVIALEGGHGAHDVDVASAGLCAFCIASPASGGGIVLGSSNDILPTHTGAPSIVPHLFLPVTI
jgi:hypothetical protein